MAPVTPGDTRVAVPQGAIVRFGPFRFERASGLLFRGAEELYLPPRAIGVLEALLSRAGEIVSKDELVTAVWHDASVTDQSPAEAVGVIRDALGDDSHTPTYIQTVHRRGYRFIAGVEYEIPAVAPAASQAASRQGTGEVAVASTPESGAATPESVSTAPQSPRSGSTPAAPAAWAWGLAGAVAGVIAAGLIVAVLPGTEPRNGGPALHLPVALDVPMIPSSPPSLAMSPDGTVLAYRGADDQQGRLHLMRLDRLDSRPLPGTEGGFGPFFSHDGQWVGYFTEGRLWKISTRGGPPVPIAETTGGQVNGASWSSDGRIFFAAGPRSGLWVVPSEGGAPELLLAPDPQGGVYGYLWPSVVDDLGIVLLSVEPVGIASAEAYRTVALSLSGLQVQTLMTGGGSQPHLLAGDRLVFARGGALFAVPLDTRRLEVVGSAEPIVHDLLTFNRRVGQFAVGADAAIVYVAGNGNLTELLWVDGEGGIEALPLQPGNFGRHRFAFDQRRLALEIDGDIWIYDLARNALTRFTTDRSAEIVPLWQPDGAAIVFSSNRTGPQDLYSRPVDRSAPAEPLLESPFPKLADSWSQDGAWLAYTEIRPDSGADIRVLELETGETMPVVQTPFDELQAAFSPDGRWLSFVANESGNFEVYVQPFPGPGPRYQVSADGGNGPAWSASGQALYYIDGARILGVEIESWSPFRASAPEVAVEVPNNTSFFTLDASRFLVGRRLQPLRPAEVRLITDAGSALRPPRR